MVVAVNEELGNLEEAKTKSFAGDAKNIVSVVENDYIVKGELGNSTYDINAINALLERKLDTSPFGNKYQHANVIITTDEDTHEYKYHICLDDGKYVIDTYKDYIDEYSVNEINSSSEACG